MIKDVFAFGLALAWVSASLVVVYGWTMNVVCLIGGSYEATSTVMMGVIGIFVPIIGPIVYFIAG